MFDWGRKGRERRRRIQAAAWALIERHGVAGALLELRSRPPAPATLPDILCVHELWAEVKRQAGMSSADTATRMLYRM